MSLFLPCLLLGWIGGSLTAAALRNSWHMVAGSALSIGLSNAIASVFGRLLMRREARPMFRPAQMAIAFPDSLVLPLLLLDELCEQSIIMGYGRYRFLFFEAFPSPPLAGTCEAGSRLLTATLS